MFLVKKCYQDTDTSLQSSIITKVKGVTFTNTSELGSGSGMLLTTSSHPRSEPHPAQGDPAGRVWLWTGHVGSCLGTQGPPLSVFLDL